jgi:hypothetical protein
MAWNRLEAVRQEALISQVCGLWPVLSVNVRLTLWPVLIDLGDLSPHLVQGLLKY